MRACVRVRVRANRVSARAAPLLLSRRIHSVRTLIDHYIWQPRPVMRTADGRVVVRLLGEQRMDGKEFELAQPPRDHVDVVVGARGGRRPAAEPVPALARTPFNFESRAFAAILCSRFDLDGIF